MIANRARVAIIGAVAALALGGATGCGGGGNGGGGEVTLKEMQDWKRDAKASPGVAALEDVDENDLIADCSGTVRDLREDVESVPAPPYKGSEWKDIRTRAVDTVEDFCTALEDDPDLGKLAVVTARLEAVGEQMKQWVEDANAKFPGLNLKTGSDQP
ncbi:hypothetical protein OH805_24920 [Streptomyces sp. NBC_00879]|uniref:hypothetical protein n=1 Tax=Streptomyces sp. NBC_00879 TaxID=2975855 RepID=UPI00386AFADB|nr:hypothetical protein OH805_24920 [Streptomyces sp. NBC_00879]